MQLAVNGENYEYDTYLLIREFYPEVKIVRLYDDTGAFRLSESGYICEYDEGVSRIAYYSGEDSGIEKRAFEYPVSVSKSDKKEYKKTHMGNLYKVLSEVTGQSLPWGDLTGVRPTKLARMMFEKGSSEEEVRSFYRNGRFVSEEKCELAIEIATCIKRELDFVKNRFPGQIPDTIYIGGGTPTALSADELRVLMDMIHGFLDSQGNLIGSEGTMAETSGEKGAERTATGLLEFTVEAGRPDSITKEKLRVLKNAGVDRISVNPQTMNDQTLVRIGRKHTVEQTVKAFELSREEGFDNINMDLILGLPGEGTEEIQKTMEEIIRMKPDSLTVHSLAIKRSAGMKGAMLSGEDSTSLGLNRNPVKMMEVAYAGAGELNLNPYYLYRQKNIAGNLENVGFASEGKYGIYNILMMEEVQSIIALGAGTVSKKVMPGDIQRCDTAKDIGLYMDGIEEMIERKKELFSDFVGHALDSRV